MSAEQKEKGSGESEQDPINHDADGHAGSLKCSYFSCGQPAKIIMKGKRRNTWCDKCHDIYKEKGRKRAAVANQKRKSTKKQKKKN